MKGRERKEGKTAHREKKVREATEGREGRKER